MEAIFVAVLVCDEQLIRSVSTGLAMYIAMNQTGLGELRNRNRLGQRLKHIGDEFVCVVDRKIKQLVRG